MKKGGRRDRYGLLVDRVGGTRGKGRWLILTHDNPDPDSIASAWILALILHRGFKRQVTIAYGGIIGRAENREMVQVLGLNMSRVRHINWRHYRHTALVDTQPHTGNNQLPEDRRPDLVIDHHPVRRASREARFMDIRPEYGASATMLGEYLLESGIDFGRRHATALVYAIRTETQDFSREFASADRRIHDQLLPHVDARALGRIQTPRLPLSYFRTLHQAVDNLESVSTLAVSHLGPVEQPDIVPELADLVVRLEGKTWSLCTGTFEDRLYLSIRTTNPRADAGRLMQRVLGRRGKGGGHGMMAGGWVPLDRAPRGDVHALQDLLASKLARALGKNPEKISPALSSE